MQALIHRPSTFDSRQEGGVSHSKFERPPLNVLGLTLKFNESNFRDGNGWSSQGSLNAPSQDLSSLPESRKRNPIFSRHLSATQTIPSEFNIRSGGFVSLLRRNVGPNAIFFAVVFLSIKSINSVLSLRSWPHINVKTFKSIESVFSESPSVANRDAKSTIPLIVLSLWVIASVQHHAVVCVFRHFAACIGKNPVAFSGASAFSLLVLCAHRIDMGSGSSEGHSAPTGGLRAFTQKTGRMSKC